MSYINNDKRIFFSDNKKYIYYGEYPQTLVKDVTLISILDTIVATDKQGYIEYNNEKYYKYSGRTYKDNENNTVSEGYHYYKVEPIKWRVLESNSDSMLVLSEFVLETHRYDKEDNNYHKSEIREWLNSTFFNTAFYPDDSLILTTIVDNSVKLKDSTNSKIEYENTYDKIFLLSEDEYMNPKYGFSINNCKDPIRTAKTTEFARSKGVLFSISEDYIYNAYYWTRTRSPYYSNLAYYVIDDGNIYNAEVNHLNYGVRPAITLSLEQTKNTLTQ